MKYKVPVAIILLCASISYAMSVKKLKDTKTTPAPASTSVATKYPQLEFLELKQFKPYEADKKLKFDLSGLAIHSDGTVYTISDKEKTPFIYRVDWSKGLLHPYLPFGIQDKLDIEAVDICGDDFYVSNEKNDKFYVVKKGHDTKKLDIDLSDYKSRYALFGGNDGFEGMAVDCANQMMYATKEMVPRFILNIDLKTNKVLKKWTIPLDDTFDFTDVKYENGFLYIVERSASIVTKVDIKTEKVIAKYSYGHIEKEPGYLYGPASHQIGEALLLTKDEIWIGFDNNGLKATEAAQKELGLKGRAPLIVRFKRPANF